jgi:hypothetical protein
MRRRRLVVIAGLVGIAVVALIGPASSALGFFSHGLTLDLQPGSPSTLVSRGAAVDVPVAVVCTSHSAFVSVEITERVGSGIAGGQGAQQVTCTGGIQAITVRVLAEGKAFKKGSGAVSADISGCGFGTCGDQAATGTTVINNPKPPHHHH